ncbi:MAG: NAD(P)H-hydrate dehydratase [Desulfovibrio sp.]|jgi:NAD(P)H-hydrate epimerase|nr:NAD(P)H-hydrate dehydratase [Desulfovibrio sp.]
MLNSDCLYADLALPEELRRRDRVAREEFGIPAAVLMENAARAALEEIHLRLAPPFRTLVFMGKGNNGGDGAALARTLAGRGEEVLVAAPTDLSGLPDPADAHTAAALKTGVRFLIGEGGVPPQLPQDWLCPDLVVDAVSGSGLQGELRARELAYVRAINSFREKSFVVALDIPSGLCGYTGRAMPEAVRARLTVAFEAAALGLRLSGGAEYAGEIVVRDIGIPVAARSPAPACRLLAPRRGAHFLPDRELHKGRAGKVLVIGGSAAMSGAPCLAAAAALRAGAGLAHLALPGGVRARLGSVFPELMVHGVGRGDSFEAEDAAALLELSRALAPDALVLGPGAGRASRAVFAALLGENPRPPAVVDADALDFPFPDRSGIRQTDVLTPHPGEAARLLPDGWFAGRGELSWREKARLVQEDRTGALAALADLYPACVVLKGARTLIRQGKGPLTVSPFAVPTLAVGGSGDVLAGAVGALLASGLPASDAAALGVYLHGRAGELLEDKAPCGHTAGEIAAALPSARKELCQV